VSAYPVRGHAELEDVSFADDLSGDETVHDIPIAALSGEDGPLQGSSAPLVPTLTVLGGIHSGQVFRLQRGRNLIGRDPHAQIFIDGSRISRHHCDIYVSAIDTSVESGSNLFRPKTCAELTDLGSTNGTRCNGRRLAAQHNQKLCPRDQIDLGGEVTLSFGVMREDELRHQTRLYRSANQDELTGTYNKRYFLTRFEEEYAWAARKDRTLSLAIIDLDHFKSINDTYGHDVGDIVLRKVADRVKQQLRREDVFARFGGEEFVILLRDTPASNAVRIADRIRKKISFLPIHTQDGIVRVTASLGVACSTEPENSTHQTLFKQADLRLYKAKASGRNQVNGPSIVTRTLTGFRKR
jgi:diguanylate cyclase (GGDEF)-like protein